MDSPAVAITVSANPGKGKANQPSGSDEQEFKLSLEVARKESDGETTTTNITIEGIQTDGTNGAGEHAEGEVTIEIETLSFTGDTLACHLSATTVTGDGSVALAVDGAFGVEGSVSGSDEVRPRSR